MAYSLGATSRAHLLGVHPRLVAVAEAAIAISAQDFTVQEGLRSLEAERKHVADGTSKTMASKHLVQPDGYGHAVDLVPFVDGRAQWLWGEPEDHDVAGRPVGGCYAVALAVQRAAASLAVPLRWGGVWDRKLADLSGSAAGLRADVAAYRARHAGADFLDGPHFELA